MHRAVRFVLAVALIVAAVALVGVFGVAAVFAQRGQGPLAPWRMMGGALPARAGTPQPSGTPYACPHGNGGYGGMMGGYGYGGMMGGYGGGMMGGAIDAATMHRVMAQALDMSVEDFDAALAQGKTPYQIGQERGMTAEQLRAAMQTAMAQVLREAVAAGKITQQQADAMLAHHAQMSAWCVGNPQHDPNFCPFFGTPTPAP